MIRESDRTISAVGDGSGITATLAEFVAHFNFEDLPARVVEVAKKHALDALAAGFVGAHLPWSSKLALLVAEQGGQPQASVFAQENRVTVSQAALLNGAMISAFEADYSGHLSHTGATVTPAALAIGERDTVTGKNFLLALVLGSETGCRIGNAQTKAVEEERGFHNPGVNGPLAAAAAAGRLLGLDASSQANAFGIAGSHSAGLAEFAWDGSMTKRLHLGRASQHGLESAMLASKGFTGPTTVIEGRYGLLHAFSPSPRPDRVLSGLGEEWLFESAMMKMYPCKGHSQGVVAAIQDLKSTRSIEPGAVTRVHVRTSDHRRMLQDRYLNPAPDSHLGAQYSLPFVTAVALVRNLDDPLQFDESVIDDEQIRRLAQLVSWEGVPEGEDGRLRLEVEVAIGDEILSTRTGPHLGSAENPASIDDIEDKFNRYSRHVLNNERRSGVIEMVRDLENIADVSELAATLHP